MSYNFVTILINTLDWRNVCWSWHIFDNSIQKFLNTFVSICCTATYWNCCTLACSFTKNFFQIINRWLFTFQIHHHKIIIKLADFLYQLCVVQFCFIFHFFWNLCNRNIFALLIIVDISFHFHQINDSFEFIFFTNWQLKTNCIFTKSCFNLIYSIVEISSKNVHLIDERHSWYIVCVCLTPYVF